MLTNNSLATIIAIIITTFAITSYAASDNIDLSGQWQLKLDPQDQGITDKWFYTSLPDTISLPGSLAEADFGNDITIDTEWTGHIVDRSWFTEDRYEKYRQPGNIKIPCWLTPNKHYVGPAWYSRTVDIPDQWQNKRIILNLQRTHWHCHLWVNGSDAGTKNSLGTPNTFDITNLVKPGKNTLSIRIDNRINDIPVGINAHSVSDHTQTNWNGIIGDIELMATDKVYIDNVQVYPNIINHSAKVKLNIINNTTVQSASIALHAKYKDHQISSLLRFNLEAKDNLIELDLSFDRDVPLWDEFNPNLIELKATLLTKNFVDTKTIQFGMREIAVKNKKISLNNKPIFLRGTLECCIFPLTGYPPTDVASWERIINICKAHGLNHMRFHSWCPPEAAFTAADELGFYIQAEASAWASVGTNATLDAWLYAEGERMLKAYGNHPSFIMMAYGNEPSGKHKEFLGKYVDHFKNLDSRRLYTSAAGWPEIPQNQYHNIPGPRVQGWGQGLRSRINAKAPETITDYSNWVSSRDVPIISHEIGQWCVYPNFKEIKKYTGVTRARNFELFRQDLDDKHMLDQAEKFLIASGKLQALCYKEDIESALRTEGFGGFQLLDLHDFPGQGTALVGVLDAFWDEKGYITAEQYHRFSCETVPLARMQKRYWLNNETFTADIQVSHFGPKDLNSQPISWTLTTNNKTIASGKFTKNLTAGELCDISKIKASLSSITKACKAKLQVQLSGTKYVNDWDIWIYPQTLPETSPKNIKIVNKLDKQAIEYLQKGNKVLLLANPHTVGGDKNGNVAIGFSSIFWNTAWTRNQPPHTLGILCNPADPIFADFPTEFHSNWQWWDLVSKSGAMIIDDLPADFRPKVQVIDTWFNNRKLGLVLEAEVLNGKLLICSIDLQNNLDSRPVARQFKYSLLKYMASNQFNPDMVLTVEKINALFKERFPGTVIKTSSQADRCYGQMLIDGNPNTIWHTSWEGSVAKYPHEIIIKFDDPTTFEGIKLLPRQDMTNGDVKDISVLVSSDGKTFKEIKKATLTNNKKIKSIGFNQPVTANYLKIKALTPQNPDHPWASFAELTLIAP
ncbi:MAG: discoidin domain-containing protein [Phycisphaerae bacterium]|nr:discoidin domain-containing protein [Phycisphaerae bacterium]